MCKDNLYNLIGCGIDCLSKFQTCLASLYKWEYRNRHSNSQYHSFPLHSTLYKYYESRILHFFFLLCYQNSTICTKFLWAFKHLMHKEYRFISISMLKGKQWALKLILWEKEIFFLSLKLIINHSIWPQ